MTHHIVDAKRLLCPLPVIRLQQAFNRIAVGDTVEIHCTDPGVLQDIPAWCRVHNHTLLTSKQVDLEIHLVVKKN